MAIFYNNQNKYTKEELRKVWEKASIIMGNDPDIFRKDKAGAWIRWSDYGKTEIKTNYGWHIDHKKPKSKGGNDDLENLQPLHWANNEAKADNYPNWKAIITSSGIKNIEKESWQSE